MRQNENTQENDEEIDNKRLTNSALCIPTFVIDEENEVNLTIEEKMAREMEFMRNEIKLLKQKTPPLKKGS